MQGTIKPMILRIIPAPITISLDVFYRHDLNSRQEFLEQAKISVFFEVISLQVESR
jgi:hypothetical protein